MVDQRWPVVTTLLMESQQFMDDSQCESNIQNPPYMSHMVHDEPFIGLDIEKRYSAIIKLR